VVSKGSRSESPQPTRTREQVEKRGLEAFVWAMAPLGLGGRRAADGLEVFSRRHRDLAAVENELGEEPRASELPVALSGLGIGRAWAFVGSGHPSDLEVPQTWKSLRPGSP
jgi:hypothetical protein